MFKNLVTFAIAVLLPLVSFAVINAPTSPIYMQANSSGRVIHIPTLPSGGGVRLAFSDLISGPDTGLGDGLGSGAIVTVWGQNLGSTQGTSTIEYCDSASTCRAGHVYYWKNADGTLPSGPANLYESHRMQEIAFSIPDSALGAGTIKVTVGAVSATLPFTVRAGNIYHVKSTGNDTTGNGSWSNPWATLSKIISSSPAGSTNYVHDVNTGGLVDRGFYWNTSSASSSLAAQFGLISYPGNHPSITAQKAVETYNTDGLVVSKLSLFASNYSAVDANDQPVSQIAIGATYGIEADAWGRAVANKITDIPGGCASRYQAAIAGGYGGYDKISGYKIYGNEIYEYGCAGTYKLHHTTYMSIRSAPADVVVAPWEFGWNYLRDNHAKFGIHQYDKTDTADPPDTCGTTSGPIMIHDNVIINQASAGISVGSECGWDMDIYIENNIVINSGLAADWDGIDPQTSLNPEIGAINFRDSGLLGTMHVRNNLIYKWVTDGITGYVNGCLSFYGSETNVTVEWNDNICYTEIDHPFVNAADSNIGVLANVSGDSNVWHYTGSNPTNAIVPSWDANPITADPLLTVTGVDVTVGASSPIINQSSTTLPRDIYGNARGATSNDGPVEN